MKIQSDRAQVVVPGSVVGFGTGFNTLGVATAPNYRVVVRAVVGPNKVTGAKTQDPQTHPGIVALNGVLDTVGAPRVGVHWIVDTQLPPGAGLGYFAAEVTAGVRAALELLGNPEELGSDFVVSQVESHGVGRLRAALAVRGEAAVLTQQDAVTFRASAVGSLSPCAFVPGFQICEQEEALEPPRTVPFEMAQRAGAAQALHVAMLTGARQPSGSLLMAATENHLENQYLTVPSPASAELVAWLRSSGRPAFVSGPGPAVVCLSSVPQSVVDAAHTSGWEHLPLGFAAYGL